MPLLLLRETETHPTKETVMPGINFDIVREAISMQQVLGLLRFQSRNRSGDQWRGPCPVHGSRSPTSRSFSVNVTEGRYYCHACHSGGHQLELWAAVHHICLYDAALSLCHECGYPIPWVTRW